MFERGMVAVVQPSGAVAWMVQGDVAAGSADSGNPVKVGGRVLGTAGTPTNYSDAQRGDLALSSEGAAIVSGASLAGDGASGGGVAFFYRGSNNTARPLAAAGYLFNETSTDRERANVAYTLLSSSARTATASSADQTNYNGRGVLVVVNVTAEAGTTTLTLTIEGKDSISSNYYSLITGVVVYNAATDTPPVTRGVLVYPGALNADAIGAGSANLIAAKSIAVPRTWRVTVTPSDASSQTYSASGVVIR